MRNELLYKAIASAFGQEPRIVNEGAPAVVTLVEPTVSFMPDVVTYLPANNAAGGEQYTVCCPYCGDTRYRLYISHMWGSLIKTEYGTYQCSKHLMNCFNERCVSYDTPEHIHNYEEVCRQLDAAMGTAHTFDINSVRQQAAADLDTIENQVKLPRICVPIDDKSVPREIVYYWTHERGYDMETLIKWGVKVGVLEYPIKKGHSRLLQFPITIIPVMQYGKFWWWQGRLTPPSGALNGELEIDEFGEAYPKYYIPAGAKKSWTLYNLDGAQKYNDVVLVEGVTDVWRVGERAMATFGKTLSSAQRTVLCSRFAGKRIILVPDMNDPDALDAAIENQCVLQSQGVFNSVDISMIQEGTDIGQHKGKEDDIWQYILTNIRSPELDMHGGFGMSGIRL